MPTSSRILVTGEIVTAGTGDDNNNNEIPSFVNVYNNNDINTSDLNNSNDHDNNFISIMASAPDPPETGGRGLVTAKSQRISRRLTESQIDFLKDRKSEMTWGRRIALSLIDKPWYNPAAAQPKEGDTEEPVIGADGKPIEKPSLERAWAYFEHTALPRFIAKKKTKTKRSMAARMIRRFQKGNETLQRAEPGEKYDKTKLYNPIFTPQKQLGDFGLGIGLYFATLRAITVITFLAGCMSIPNILYFSSTEYTNGEDTGDWDLPDLLRGSAICTNQQWVPCPTCNCAHDDTRRQQLIEEERCAFVEADNGEILTFALKNFCNGATFEQGMINYGTMLLIFICTMFLGIYLRNQEVKFDEDEQTAQDYSIVIKNPPPDATDPDEWRNYFRDNCDGAVVTVCTVAVNNDLLVRTLAQRREVLRHLENSLPPGTDLSILNLAYLAAKEERDRKGLSAILGALVGGVPELFAKLVALNAKVQGLAQLDYPATKVFVTFETESDQRNVLSKLSVGSLRASRNDHSALSDKKYLFRGAKVLSVEEPDEPNTIRWEDLNTTFKERMKQQALTIFCTLVAIVLVAVAVSFANRASTVGAAFAISIFNSVFPMFAKALTDTESHASEGDKQTSLYFKIAAFRWVNTAIVITIVTPFTHTLNSDGLIPQIYALFFAEIITTNAIQLADPVGHLKRHLLAPRATNQDAMNINFQGEQVELAERYTNMTKILFLALWYCAIYPGAFFMCSFALLINYFTDRFSLMRTWKRPPHLGTSISKFSRKYFFSLAIVAMSVISSFYWSAFPFDNLCAEESSPLPLIYQGNFTVIPNNVNKTDFEEIMEHGQKVLLSADDTSYQYCLQDLLVPGGGNTFPFVSGQQASYGIEWMTEEQERVADIYGWSSLAVTGLVIISFVLGWIRSFRHLFKSSYSAVGDDQGIPYSEVPTINAYIPEVTSTMFSYNLLACDVDDLDQELFDWQDPDRPFSYYDLTKDADFLLRGMDVSSTVGFSRIKHWPPHEPEEDQD